MREAGLRGCCRGRTKRTISGEKAEWRPATPDLVMRDFRPEAADRPWVADITYTRSWEGWLYLAFVLDTGSRKVLRWSMVNHLRTDLVLDALNMAVWHPRPRPPFRSRQPVRFREVRREAQGEAGLLLSMGSVADAYDNALAESFVTHQGASAGRHLRVHRRVLQREEEALRFGLSQFGRIRGR